MRSVRTVVRTLIAGFLALAGPLLVAPAVAAHAQQSSRTDTAFSHQLTVSIDAVSPSFATANSTVTVTGTLTNDTGSPLAGVQVQLLTSYADFLTRSQMDSYAAGGNSALSAQPIGTAHTVRGTLHSGTSVRWSASFSAAAAGYGQFGVYPLEAQAVSSGGTPLASDRTFLPFWPGKNSADPLTVSWVWPLIDQPQQGPCPQTLATNSLASSFGSGGRLDTLLSVGAQWAAKDHLTWAVDPALLSDAQVMTKAYLVGGDRGGSLCKGGSSMRASAAASAWLATLRSETAGEPMFITPYADADVSALTHAGLSNDLRTAYQLGESAASQILHRSFGIKGDSTGGGGSPAVAWPAGGEADASVLTSLADYGGISTVVLNSGEVPAASVPYDDDHSLALTSTGSGSPMRVLLSDSELTSVLGSASASSTPAAQFATEQDFLAQTAMISAEAPFLKRSVIITPSRRWDPSAAEASALLSLTRSAPWLHTVALSSVADAAGGLKARTSLPGTQVKAAELSTRYITEVRSVDTSLELYTELLSQPAASLLSQLDAAVAVTESTAWRSPDAAGGWLALGKFANYLLDRETDVRILSGTKLLLAGASGPAPVSVQNAGGLPIQVRVVAVSDDGHLTIDNPHPLITVQAGKTGTVRMTMHSSAIGTTQVRLELLTKNGSPLTWPEASQLLSVESTRYGRTLLVLIGAALGVLVLTSVARWVRRSAHDSKTDGRSGDTG
jgi:Family of unknown function (DUF6049)